MDSDSYAKALGKLIANLQGLEYMLRCYLYMASDGKHDPFPYGKALDAYEIGDIVPENAFSCYDSLKELVVRYNNRLANSPQFQIDPGVVELRDALAHGRIASDTLEGDYVLVKTGKGSKKGSLLVTHRQTLTAKWLEEQTKFVAAEVKKVAATPEMSSNVSFG